MQKEERYKPKVFVVEDQAGVRELICTLCETAGLTVEAYDSAEAFLAAYVFTESGCLVLDTGLSGMSGLELLAQLAIQAPHLPVILISGSAEPSLHAQAHQLGAADFFEKPFDVYALLRRIRQCLNRIARQPILSHQHQLIGYELLARSVNEQADNEDSTEIEAMVGDVTTLARKAARREGRDAGARLPPARIRSVPGLLSGSPSALHGLSIKQLPE